ncbi:MAG: DNA polymerase III subunit delta [Thermodesulfobacteriota bacterium]
MKFNRQDINKLYQELDQGRRSPVYLIFGERFLCQQAAGEITRRLLGPEGEKKLIKVAGEQEDVRDTVNRLRTFSLFGGPQVVQVKDSRLFLSKAVGKKVWDRAKKAAGSDKKKAGLLLAQLAAIGGLADDDHLPDLSAAQWRKAFGFARPADISWCQTIDRPPAPPSDSAGSDDEILAQALEHGLPDQNHLIIFSETVDKRKKIFKIIGDLGTTVDLSVEEGASSAARKNQDAVVRQLLSDTFSARGKKPGPRVLEKIMERVGFHPVAAVHEAEKLALFSGDEELISVNMVDEVTCKSREEALFELNDAVASRNLAQTLALLQGLLRAGLHGLVIVAAMRNLLRKLMFIRALQEQQEPAYRPGQAYGQFQKGYLAIIKEEHGDSEFLKGHPFVIYKGFQQAERFSLPQLRRTLGLLLESEFKLKSSPLAATVVLENFFFAALV